MIRAGRPWTRRDVAVKTLFAARGLSSRRAVARYLIRRFRRTRDAWTGRIRFNDGMELEVSSSLGGLSAYYEIFIQQVYGREPDFIPSGEDMVVDVGASIGIYSIWAAMRQGAGATLLSIEPHPESFTLLERNVRMNGIRAHLFNVGCSDASGSLELHFDPSHLVTSSFHGIGAGRASIGVPVRTLDELVLGTPGPKHRLLLKIDVEGWELSVLRGATRSLERASRVVMECGDEEAAGDAVGYLGDHGFQLANIVERVWNDPHLRILYFRKRD